MAYNNALSTYPQYQMYPANSYQQSYGTVQQPVYQQPANSFQTQQAAIGIVWVDGEIGAKAYQLPANWPANSPMPLWDTNDTIIYLKSTNPMGMPNPLQKIHYRMEETSKQPMMQSGQTALPPAEQTSHDRSDYVTKDDLERLKEELTSAITGGNAPNGNRKGGKTNESAV